VVNDLAGPAERALREGPAEADATGRPAVADD
jgi:hypothetical protein